MPPDCREYLLDVTRLISRGWTGRQSTGIDRVCIAYLERFRARAHAVVQHRGVIRVLDGARSDALFDLLMEPSQGFRLGFARLVPAILRGNGSVLPDKEQTYLNMSHTDFDLPEHWAWVRRSGVRSVYFVHDLIPILTPEFSRPHAVERHLGRVAMALRHASHLVTSSAVVARDLADFAACNGVEPPPITVSPIAGKDLSKHRPCPPAFQSPYFLCVGTIEPRKNHTLLFEVWRKLVAEHREQAPRLVCVGQTGPMTGDILTALNRHRELRDFVDLRPSCSDESLRALMANASALLMPSRAEGYGLPVVEALQAGTPVIASDLAIFREIGRGLPRFLPCDDIDGWSEAILSCAMQDKPRICFKAPDWPTHFAKLEAALAPSDLPSDTPHESSLAA